MTAPRTASELSRRGFLGGALAGGALCLGVSFGAARMRRRRRRRMVRRADQTGELSPNMYVTVKPDGRVALTVGKCEMGQGVTTGYSTLVAEELEVAVDHIDVAFADSLPEFRTSGAEGVPMFRIHATGGSTSTAEAYIPLRRAAASAREMLVAAAARQWGVAAADCARRGRPRRAPGQRARRRLRRASRARAARESVPGRAASQAPGRVPPDRQARAPRSTRGPRSPARRASASTCRCRAWCAPWSSTGRSTGRSRPRCAPSGPGPRPA